MTDAIQTTHDPETDDRPDSQELSLVRSTIDSLIAQSPERAVAAVRARIEALAEIRTASILATTGNDWTLNRDLEGHVAATLRRSGAERIRKFWGISVFPRGDVLIRTAGAGRVAEIFGDAICALTGERTSGIRGYRLSNERFIGRDAADVGDEDLKQAARTSLETKAVRILAGMSAVAVADLEVAWKCDAAEVEKRCYRGQGYGSSDDRRATRLITEPQQKRLWALASKRAKEAGGSADAIVRAVLGKFGFEKSAEVTMGVYDEVCAAAEAFKPAPGPEQA